MDPVGSIASLLTISQAAIYAVKQISNIYHAQEELEALQVSE